MIPSQDNSTIKEADEFLFDKIRVYFIDKNSLPDTSDVSAVFLVGFINDKIVASRNERGWDIPGGHIELFDQDLISAMRRETLEEAGVLLGEAMPYAIMKFKGENKVMLFYTSKDCQLTTFTPSEDAFERALMAIPDFIACYNWKKDIIKLLIDKARLILEN